MRTLRLRAGEWVEIRTREEILATLDEEGRLADLPFMPEMLQFCGRRVRVYKSAHKTCDTIRSYRNREMKGAVHLDGLRCDGQAHGGCQANCLLFWKTEWLRRAPAQLAGGTDRSSSAGPSNPSAAPTSGDPPNPSIPPAPRDSSSEPPAPPAQPDSRCDIETLARATQAPVPATGAEESGASAAPRSVEPEPANGAEGTTANGGDERVRYFCQATELLRATTPLRRFDLRPYWKDLTSRNVGFGPFLFAVLLAAFNTVMRLHHRGHPLPYIRGLAGERTPRVNLNLQPGEMVRIRSKREIMTTINRRQRNRGLWFDVEMVPYCGRTARILRRVERIIDERTGLMMRLPNPCIMLEGVVCRGHLSQGRLFCPRSIQPFWHEIWLRRVE